MTSSTNEAMYAASRGPSRKPCVDRPVGGYGRCCDDNGGGGTPYCHFRCECYRAPRLTGESDNVHSTTVRTMAGGHVIHFLDHPLLPADSPSDSPKIVKNGINDDGPMHPDSPHVSGPDGVATLLYRMGREDWLKRFLDTRSTQRFDLTVKKEPYQTLYVKRVKRDVEVCPHCGLGCSPQGKSPQMGFYDAYRDPAPGIRYRVNSKSNWTPVSTSDLGDPWGGSQVWFRAQGEAFCKAIWYGALWKPDSVPTISWTDITDAERADNSAAVATLVARGEIQQTD